MQEPSEERVERVSYSRWGNSVWYTYWATSGPKDVEGQIFIVAGVGSATYGVMKQDFDGVLEKFVTKALDPQVFATLKDVTDTQREELSRYMKLFMHDVEDEYLEKSDGTRRKDGPPTTEDPTRGG
jgi:hypothetical protein